MNCREYEKECERIKKYEHMVDIIKKCEKSVDVIQNYENEIKFYYNSPKNPNSCDIIGGLEECDFELLKEFVLQILHERIEKTNRNIEGI